MSQEKVAHLDALRLADAVRTRLANFAADDHYTRSPELNSLCRRLWEGDPESGGLLSELWVEGAFPAEQSEYTLDRLTTDGLVHPDLRDQLDRTAAMPRGRPLYTHQHEAVVAARGQGPGGERPSLVVTAGTGAGKTECFLLPLLNDLYSQPGGGAGVQCLILYPMNALVNDQVDRLHSWLRGQSQVRLFHFTSETPENKRAADYDRVPKWEGVDAFRVRTRQESRGLEGRDGKPVSDGVIGPQPDIVITNYSMLEYMLCRPQDAVFFGPSLRAVVLDEAHLYTGTLAAEITLLLRRLYARCGVEARHVLQIATSATLGSGNTEELRTFAAKLFSKEETSVHVIVGRNARAELPAAADPVQPPTTAAVTAIRWLDRPLLVADAAGAFRLAEDTGLCDRLRQHLPLLTTAPAPADECRPAALLHATLGAAPLLHRLEDTLWQERRLPLPELAQRLWQDTGKTAVAATTVLLQLAASARQQTGDYPLVPHRIHLLARAPDGLVVCLNAECDGPATDKLAPLGKVSAAGRERCPSCQGAVLSLYRCDNCGEWLLAGSLDGNRYRPVTAVPWDTTAPQQANPVHFFTTRIDTSARADQTPTPTVLTLGLAKAERSGEGAAGAQVAQVTTCPHCSSGPDDFQPFSSTSPLALAILAETVFAELPEYPAAHNPYLPARGRRLLAFSDSRQEAARLGPRLTRQHDTQLVRAAIVKCLKQQPKGTAVVMEHWQKKVQEYDEELRSLSDPNLRQEVEEDLRRASEKLQSFRAGGSMAHWGSELVKKSNQLLLAELLEVDTGQRHVAQEEAPDGKPRPWSQVAWDKNWEQICKGVSELLAREFATPSWRKLSAETLGLAEITYPGLDALEVPPTLLGDLPNDTIRQAVQGCWTGLLHALCDTLRVEGDITLGGRRQEDQAYRSGGVPIGQWCAKSETGYYLNRFVGDKPDQRRRQFASAVLRECGVAAAAAVDLGKRLLEAAFDQLYQRAVIQDEKAGPGQLPFLERHDSKQTKGGPPAAALRLVFPQLGLRRPTALWKCRRTSHVWGRSIRGCAPEKGCNGTLELVSDEILNADPRLSRLRQEYRHSPVFQIGLWAEEHSAQLTPRENRRLQDLFKAGIRNVLSATTTLELGIDIGGLAAVLLSNVPPGKANYLQRGGRAGRRADGSAAVVTFVRPRPFDREVFRRFGDYLDMPLRKPLVFLDRARVVRRHLHAYLLGEFFRSLYGAGDRTGAMNAFGDMGKFCGKPLPPYWRHDGGDVPVLPPAAPGLEEGFLKHLHSLHDFGDEALQQVAADLFAGTILEGQTADWSGLIDQVIKVFQDTVKDWNDDYEPLRQAWLEAVQAGVKAQANAIRYQMKLLWELTVIEALADRQFLPRYGFPIGLQKLRVLRPDEEDKGKSREEDQYRLERPGLLALGEYVPGSQLLAGGKLVTSRGLLKHWTGANLDSSPGLRGRFCRCENGHEYYWIANAADRCPVCDGGQGEGPLDLLFVKHGFTGAAWDPPRWSTDVERVGSAEKLTITFKSKVPAEGSRRDFGGIKGLSADYREDGELLVYNRGDERRGFAICLKCGYADSEHKLGAKGKLDLPPRFLRHAPITATGPWEVCWKDGDQSAVLRNQILAARSTTDVLLLDFSGCLAQDAADDSLVNTLAFACQRAATRRLELDARELGVLIVPTGADGQTRGAVLFDNVPGGAGHVGELLVQGPEWLRDARQVLYIDAEHDQRCESACLDCLLSFDAQMAMSQRPFVRRRALEQLNRLLGMDS